MRSGPAAGASSTCLGCEMVLKASCTMPTFSKMPLTSHMIQADMLLMRITMPSASVIAPSVMLSWLHSHSAMPAVPTISTPFSVLMDTSIAVMTRVDSRCFSVCSASA